MNEMKKIINAGGAAFPNSYNNMGMTLRDYFAAKAMAAIIASQPDSGHCRILESNVAEHAYELADAMLEARK